MSEQDDYREAQRYAEWQQEQEAYEQAQYDDELLKAQERITELEAEEKRRQPEKGMLTVDKNRYSELLEAEKMNGYLTATIEKARNLPTYLCEFPDIGKVGPAIRQWDLWAALAEAQKETPPDDEE